MHDTKHLFVEFYMDSKLNKKKTNLEKREVWDDVEMIRIRFVGDNKQDFHAPAHNMSFDPEEQRQMTYAERFPRHYEAFKQGRLAPEEGTPLDQLPGITKSKVNELAAQNVRTIEGLAQLDGSGLAKLGMGGREWKNKAEAWLAGSGDEKVKNLEAQLAEMARKLAAMEGGKEPADDVEVEEKRRLRAEIKDKTGQAVRGNPSLDTLREMAATAGAEAAA